MDTDRVVVECHDCELQESFANLSGARLALDEHESATGHAVDWQIRRVEAGVERAGADAGVCGVSGCENPYSPLVSHPSTSSSARESATTQRDEPTSKTPDGETSNGKTSAGETQTNRADGSTESDRV